MNKSKEKDINNWDLFLNKQLGFKARSHFPSGGNDKSEISVYECNDKSKIVSIDSAAYTCDLKSLSNQNNAILIFNSLSDLYHVHDNIMLHAKDGTSNILPSNIRFKTISPFRRRSISLILDTTNYLDYEDKNHLNNILWKNSMKISFGYLIDKFMNDLYDMQNVRKMEKIKNIIGSTIALSVQKDISSNMRQSEIFDDIINIIDNNHRDSNFSLTSLANKIGVTTRTIQNILSKYNIKFYCYLQNKRCFYLKLLLSNNKIYNVEYLSAQAGFKNFIAADRQFCKLFNMSIKQYMKL